MNCVSGQWNVIRYIMRYPQGWCNRYQVFDWDDLRGFDCSLFPGPMDLLSTILNQSFASMECIMSVPFMTWPRIIMESFRESPPVDPENGPPSVWFSWSLSQRDHTLNSNRKARGRKKITYLSHLDPGVLFDRMHLAFAVEHCAQAAPHLAVAGLGLWPSALDIILGPDKICDWIKSVQERKTGVPCRTRTSPAEFLEIL